MNYDEVCEHGVYGGCELSCEECGHMCRRHAGLHCEVDDDEGETCDCDGFRASAG